MTSITAEFIFEFCTNKMTRWFLHSLHIQHPAHFHSALTLSWLIDWLTVLMNLQFVDSLRIEEKRMHRAVGCLVDLGREIYLRCICPTFFSPPISYQANTSPPIHNDPVHILIGVTSTSLRTHLPTSTWECALAMHTITYPLFIVHISIRFLHLATIMSLVILPFSCVYASM